MWNLNSLGGEFIFVIIFLLCPNSFGKNSSKGKELKNIIDVMGEEIGICVNFSWKFEEVESLVREDLKVSSDKCDEKIVESKILNKINVMVMSLYRTLKTGTMRRRESR